MEGWSNPLQRIQKKDEFKVEKIEEKLPQGFDSRQKIPLKKKDPKLRIWFYLDEEFPAPSSQIEPKDYGFPLKDQEQRELQKIICSFLNTKGGRIYLGLDKSGRVNGIFLSSEEQLEIEKQIQDLLTVLSPHNVDPNLISVHFIPIVDRQLFSKLRQGLFVIKIIVRQETRPQMYVVIQDGAERFYLRENEVTRQRPLRNYLRMNSQLKEEIPKDEFKDIQPSLEPVYKVEVRNVKSKQDFNHLKEPENCNTYGIFYSKTVIDEETGYACFYFGNEKGQQQFIDYHTNQTSLFTQKAKVRDFPKKYKTAKVEEAIMTSPPINDFDDTSIEESADDSEQESTKETSKPFEKIRDISEESKISDLDLERLDYYLSQDVKPRRERESLMQDRKYSHLDLFAAYLSRKNKDTCNLIERAETYLNLRDKTRTERLAKYFKDEQFSEIDIKYLFKTILDRAYAKQYKPLEKAIEYIGDQ